MKRPVHLGAELAEPADGTQLVLITHAGGRILAWRDDHTARTRRYMDTVRWFDTEDHGYEPTTWLDITSNAKAIHAVETTPIIGR